MKNLRIAICIASLGSCKSRFAISLAGLCARLSTQPVSPEVDSQLFTVFYEESSVLPQSQYNLVKKAQAWDASHILFLEDDMEFPADSFARLFAHKKPWVAANYLKRSGPPYEPCARKLDGSPLWTMADSSGLEPAYVAPLGVTLFLPEIFQKVPSPWFAMPWVQDSEYFASTDGYLSMTGNQLGLTPLIDHDLSKEIKHLGNRSFTWEDGWEWLKSPNAAP